MMRLGFTIMITSGIMIFVSYYLIGVTLMAILPAIILFYFGSTFIWPNAFATAFTPYGKIAGYAGSLYGFMQIGGAAVIGVIISYLPANQLSLAIVILVTSILAWLSYELSYK